MAENGDISEISPDQDAVQDLLKKADEHIDCFEYDVAQQFCNRALDLDSKSLPALEMSASLYLELNQPEKAKSQYEFAVQLNPSAGHSKYLSLAQLCEGQEAVENYRKGIDIMCKQLFLGLADESEEKVHLKRELSDAYCSLSEVYTTDLCDDADAENECVTNMQKAVTVDPSNPESYLCYANYHLIMGRREEAKQMLSKSLNLWYPQMVALMDGTADQQVDPVELFPIPYNSRVTTAKLLIELEDYEVASDILDVLVSENDEDFEVWYMLGVMNYQRGEDFAGNTRFYLKKARSVALKTGNENPEMLKDVESVLDEIGPGNPEDEESPDEDKENTHSDSYETIFEDSDSSMDDDEGDSSNINRNCFSVTLN